MTDPIVTLEVRARFPGAKEAQTSAGVGRAAAQGGAWACAAELGPVDAYLAGLGGSDAPGG